jgi:hypothetical protein
MSVEQVLAAVLVEPGKYELQACPPPELFVVFSQGKPLLAIFIRPQ